MQRRGCWRMLEYDATTHGACYQPSSASAEVVRNSRIATVCAYREKVLDFKITRVPSVLVNQPITSPSFTIPMTSLLLKLKLGNRAADCETIARLASAYLYR